MDLLKQLKESVGVNKLMEPVNRINKIAATIESLTKLVTDNKVSSTARTQISGLMELVRSRPTLTSINHYFNHFLLQLEPENQPPVLKELLEVYHDRWKNVERKTAEQAFAFLDFSEETSLLLHHTDKTVLAVMNLLAVKNARVKVYQTLSRPNSTGTQQAEDIMKLGFPVQVIDDNTVAQVLPDVDYVIVGCDVIMHEDFINKVGTHTLAAAAKYYKRPLYVVGDSRKILNRKYFPQSVTVSLVGGHKGKPEEIWENAPKGITIENNYREYIPNYLVEAFILENAIFSPEELKTKIDKVVVTTFV